jgi:hypothetical protein
LVSQLACDLGKLGFKGAEGVNQGRVKVAAAFLFD